MSEYQKEDLFIITIGALASIAIATVAFVSLNRSTFGEGVMLLAFCALIVSWFIMKAAFKVINNQPIDPGESEPPGFNFTTDEEKS